MRRAASPASSGRLWASPASRRGGGVQGWSQSTTSRQRAVFPGRGSTREHSARIYSNKLQSRVVAPPGTRG